VMAPVNSSPAKKVEPSPAATPSADFAPGSTMTCSSAAGLGAPSPDAAPDAGPTGGGDAGAADGAGDDAQPAAATNATIRRSRCRGRPPRRPRHPDRRPRGTLGVLPAFAQVAECSQRAGQGVGKVAPSAP
jgi:hypothetical protein